MRRITFVVLSILFLASCSGLGKGYAPSTNAGGPNARTSPESTRDLREKVEYEWYVLEGKEQQVPITLNDQVLQSIQFFQNDARKFMTRALGRSHKYMPMLQRVLREKNLPPDLAYLALIESGYRVDAVSPAGAVGMWQFIAPTGKRYGLRIDDFADERMHPEKATYAAADYLKELHEMFGSYNLAAAAYNCGEGKILRGLKTYSCTNFWELASEKNFLRDETKDYVPRFLAAVIIAKDPEKYGFTVVPEEPDKYDEVTVPTATDLGVVARLAGVKEQDIRALNPHIKLWCTPLDEKNYAVKVPFGTASRFNTAYASLPHSQRLKMSVHTVRRGESIKKIAAAYNLSAATLKKYNGLKSYQLSAGQKIKLPVDAGEYMARQKEYQAKAVAERRQQKTVTYKVRPGDNPWMIAQKYDLNWKDIAVWNNIKDVRKLKAGDQLVLYFGPGEEPDRPSPQPVKTAGKMDRQEKKSPQARNSNEKPAKTAPAAYKVQNGDTLWRVATRFNMKIEELRAMNSLKNNSIHVGQVLRVGGSHAETGTKKSVAETRPEPVKKTPEPRTASAVKPAEKPGRAPKSTTYTVQKDDTVWRVSQKFGLAPEKLKALNGLKDNNIRHGQVLKVSDAAASVPSPVLVAAAVQKPAAGKKTSYQVQDGDTLWKIARRFNVDPNQIRTWNSMPDNNIRPGDVLTINKGS